MTVAHMIRAARVDAGLSQGQLASLASTSQPAVSAYENASQSPTVSTLERLLAACGRAITSGARTDGSSLASLVSRFVNAGEFDDEAFVLRWSLNQFARNEWDELTFDEKAQALRVRPQPCGSKRWDAFFAALAEYLAVSSGVPVPGWVHDLDRVVVGERWFPGRAGDRERASRRVDRDPAPWFVSRNIGLEMRALPSGKGKHVAAAV